VAKAPPREVSGAAPKDEKAMMRSLFSNATPTVTPAAATAPVQVSTARAKAQPSAPSSGLVAQASSNLAMGFTAQPIGDLATDRFTGPAVKPLALR
jgi:hypothetical protein